MTKSLVNSAQYFMTNQNIFQDHTAVEKYYVIAPTVLTVKVKSNSILYMC